MSPAKTLSAAFWRLCLYPKQSVTLANLANLGIQTFNGMPGSPGLRPRRDDA